MGNDVVTFKSWLDAYGHAWDNRNPEAATALYAEKGTYQVTPFLKPMCGRKAIFEYWSEVARTEENIPPSQFGLTTKRGVGGRKPVVKGLRPRSGALRGAAGAGDVGDGKVGAWSLSQNR